MPLSPPDGTARRRSRLGASWSVDRAIVFAVGARVWQFLAGALSWWIIARNFNLEIQGFYGNFVQLLGAQTFFDLGLTGVLVYVASHEWAAARKDDAAAETARRRLGELLIRSRRWYTGCSAGFSVLALVLGWWYFHDEGNASVHWQAPWIVAVLLTAGSLWLSPSIVILEGCNYVAEVNALRFAQVVAGNLVVWTVILCGGELWAVPASAAVRLAAEAYLVFRPFRPFIDQLLRARQSGAADFSWHDELLPLQWRIAVQAVAAYCLVLAFAPVISKVHGMELGGRTWMTINAISTIQLVALAWIQTRVPRIGALLAAADAPAAHALFRGTLAICMAVYAAGCAAFLALVLILQRWLPSLAERVLEPGPVTLIAVGMGLTLLVSGLSTYVRAHKLDPFLTISVLNGVMTGAAMWYCGAKSGPGAAAAAQVATTALFMLPATYVIYRRIAFAPLGHRDDG